MKGRLYLEQAQEVEMKEADTEAKEEGVLHPLKPPEGTCRLHTPSVVFDVVARLALLSMLA